MSNGSESEWNNQESEHSELASEEKGARSAQNACEAFNTSASHRISSCQFESVLLHQSKLSTTRLTSRSARSGHQRLLVNVKIRVWGPQRLRMRDNCTALRRIVGRYLMHELNNLEFAFGFGELDPACEHILNSRLWIFVWLVINFRSFFATYCSGGSGNRFLAALEFPGVHATSYPFQRWG